MDVICVTGAGNKLFSTEFYIKLRFVPITAAATLAMLGADHGDSCGGNGVATGGAAFGDVITTSSAATPPTLLGKIGGVHDAAFHLTDEDIVAAEAADIFAEQDPTPHAPPADSNRVDVYCNQVLCNGIVAFVGGHHLLHFYDTTTHLYATTPNHKILSQMHLKSKRNVIDIYYQGNNVSSFNIWHYTLEDKLVVVDLDGTITKSDLTGYVQTVYLGMFKYIHEGVVPFLNIIKESFGCNIVYLTSRPMAHRQATKDMLLGIKEDGLSLPDGPLFNNKERLVWAIYRELSKQTVVMKSSVLIDINEVFRAAGGVRGRPQSVTPFVFGIGNKDNDAYAYNAAGIPADCIIIIDTSSLISVWGYKQAALQRATSSAPQSARPIGKFQAAVSTVMMLKRLVRGKSSPVASPSSSENFSYSSDSSGTGDNMNSNNSHNHLVGTPQHLPSAYGSMPDLDRNCGGGGGTKSDNSNMVGGVDGRHGSKRRTSSAIFEFNGYKDFNLLRYVEGKTLRWPGEEEANTSP